MGVKQRTMKLKRVVAAVFWVFSASSVWAIEPFVVKDIRVEGLQRTEVGTVFNYLPIKVGETFNDEKATLAIKSLFTTGFFNDVRIESQGDTVIVSVTERPVISQLMINGAREFDKDQLKKALKENGLAESRIFDPGLLSGGVQELKRQYHSRGKYSVEIATTMTKLERNRVAITLDIREGATAKIDDICIVGTKAFSSPELLDQFSLSTGGWLSWLTKDNQYSKQKLTGDLERLRAYYQNRGYFECNIDSTQVAISPNKQQLYVTVNVHEGSRFTIGELKLAGDLKVPEQELKALLHVQTNDVFNREKINESIKAIEDRLGKEGYAFANINVIPEVDQESHRVNFTFFIDPGRKAYVRRITITGNTRTRDEVIRRELRQLESAYYNAASIKRSKERIELLGYFDDVTVTTPAVTDAPDQVDININLKERPTGSISAGAGYVQGDGLQLSLNLSQANIFGSGKALAVGLSTSKANRLAQLQFTDPYFTPDGVSLGYNIYHRDYNPDKINLSAYRTLSSGLSTNIGVPITEYDRINYSLGFDQTKITTFPDSSPTQYINFVNQYGSKNNTITASMGWGRDTRDSVLWPTRGYSMSALLDGGLPGGDIQFYRLGHSQKWFFPLGKSFTLMMGGEVGWAEGYGRTSTVPFFQNYYLGGIGSVRGYSNGSLGPLDKNNDALGGTRKVVGNAELLFPLPGIKDSRAVRLSLFVDAGSIWGNATPSTPAYPNRNSFNENLRYSSGGALTWLSPMGPMKFSVALPLKKRPGDKLERFQFQLGTIF